MAHEEYLRRNLFVASACGARAALEATLKRLDANKRTSKWLREKIVAANSRVSGLSAELAIWRDAAGDAPRNTRRSESK